MIAFHTWYRRQGITYLAIRLAELVDQLGFGARFISFGHHDDNVHPDWDKRVLRHSCSTREQFVRSIEGCSWVVWPEFVLEEYAAWAKECGCKTAIIPMWERLTKESIRQLCKYDVVVAVSKAIERLLVDRYKLSNVRYIPWDIGTIGPVHPLRKPRNDERVRLFFPSAGPQLRRQTSMWIDVLGRIMSEYQHVDATVSYLRNWWSESYESLAALSYRFGPSGRLKVVGNQSWYEHRATYADHDLTVWPTISEGLGLIGLESLSHGTPVLAFDIPPINEYLTHGFNSYLVGCRHVENEVGVVSGEYDSGDFKSSLRRLIDKASPLDALQMNASRSTTVSEMFTEGWKNVFSAV